MPAYWTLRRTLLALPLAWTGAWLGYYAYTDTLRRSHIRARIQRLSSTPGLGPGEIDYTLPATEAEKAAIKTRFASLRFAGRFWNPYVEWREQGAWEWFVWKAVLSIVTLKLFYDGGVPRDRVFTDLPMERPDFKLLFGDKGVPPVDEAEERARKAEMQKKGRGADVEVTDKLTMTWVCLGHVLLGSAS